MKRPKCPKCGGDRIVETHTVWPRGKRYSLYCETCHHHWLKKEGPVKIACPDCDGKGGREVDDGQCSPPRWEKCSRCDGTGKIEVQAKGGINALQERS